MHQVKEVLKVTTKKSIQLNKIKRYRGGENVLLKCINNIVHSRDSTNSM